VRRPLSIVAAVLLATIVPLTGCGRDLPAEPGVDTVATAERAEPLALVGTTLDGQPFDLADLRGRIMVRSVP
jgi:hypothetical protein